MLDAFRGFCREFRRFARFNREQPSSRRCRERDGRNFSWARHSLLCQRGPTRQYTGTGRASCYFVFSNPSIASSSRSPWEDCGQLSGQFSPRFTFVFLVSPGAFQGPPAGQGSGPTFRPRRDPHASSSRHELPEPLSVHRHEPTVLIRPSSRTETRLAPPRDSFVRSAVGSGV